ncbi:MAG: type II toxin-antitoxin system HigB family toxin [Stigonema ocellatum SAG 48.90 = DSM 106950]|nr:type II toxin-antitoxin system HigB family toxin [Stigonema ocellatum SAG 48.90 = DSM 106950]
MHFKWVAYLRRPLLVPRLSLGTVSKEAPPPTHKRNDYRLIVGIDYENQVVYYKYFLTHAEYDKDKWKNDPYF